MADLRQNMAQVEENSLSQSITVSFTQQRDCPTRWPNAECQTLHTLEKFNITLSGVGVGAVCVCVGLYIIYTETLTVIPQICYMAYIVFATLGHYTLPVLIMSELYPLQVRGMLGGLSTSMINLSIFAVNALYPYMTKYLGFPYTIITFGVCSLLGAVFLYFFLPETKDLTLQEIEEFYNERRSTLTSQRRIVSMMALPKAELSRADASKSLIRITDKYKKDKKLDKSKSEVRVDKRDEGSTSRKE